MPPIILLGAGMCGLATGLLLARDGHDVALLERDPAPVPDSPDAAWERWARRGVAQFNQAHFLQAPAPPRRLDGARAGMPRARALGRR